MTDPVLLAAAREIAASWAESGGKPVEYGIACRDGELLAVAGMAVTPRWDDAARRGVLGALVRATECESFGYLVDSNVQLGGRPTEAMLCLELVVVDLAEKVVGAAAHLAPYARRRKRLGRDQITMAPFERLEGAEYGSFVGDLTTLWHLEGDDGRLRALNVLSEAGAELSDLHPSMRVEFATLVERSGG